MAKSYQPAQIANAFFELADAREKPDGTGLYKIITQEPSMTQSEKHQIRLFLKRIEGIDEDEEGMAMNCLMHSRIIVTVRKTA